MLFRINNAVILKNFSHFFLQFACFGASHGVEIGSLRGMDDAARRVYKKSALFGDSIFCHLLQAAALCSHTGNEQEVVGHDSPHVFKHFPLGRTYDIHHVSGIAPFLRLGEHFLEKRCAVVVGCELEVLRAFVGCEREEYHPFAVVAEEWSYTVFAHIRCHGECVNIHHLEKRVGIHFRCVAYVAAFCIGNDEDVGVVAADIVDCVLKCLVARQALRLVECEIGLEGNGIVGCSVDY